MAKKDRVELIKTIQEIRNSFLLTYITSTRSSLEVQMAMDAIRRVYEHLQLINTPKEDTKIDLFIHSNGGDGTVPWRLVTLIREYASEFSVLVPYRAFSAATLTALGADNIVMHPMGMLGPTDPTVTNPFNPSDPHDPNKKLGINVEDVSAYIALIKDDAGITHEDELVQAIKILAENVHPLALGNVKKFLSQSRMMARKLLSLHMDNNKEEHKITDIVDNITSKLYYHGHPINRIEATQQIGIPTIKQPSSEIETLMWKLYLDYEETMMMEQPFRPVSEFLTKKPNLQPNVLDKTKPEKAKLAFIESGERTDMHYLDYQLSGQIQPNGSCNVTTIVRNQAWEIL